MTKKTKTKTKTSNWGLSIGQQVDGKDIKLLGVSKENLKLANCIYNYLPEESSLETIIPQNTTFFYKVEKFDHQAYTKRELLGLEVGVGEIIQKGKSFFLQRQRCKRFYTPETGNLSQPDGKPHNFPPSSYLIVTSYAPKSLEELFSLEDTVIAL